MTCNPNRMQEAADVLMEQFQQFASVAIVYSRGSTRLPSIQATPGRTFYDVEMGGVLVAVETRDYTMAAVDLGGLTPASGDRITEEDGTVYEVSCPKGFNVFERMGPNRTIFKIHTIGPK